MWRQLRDTSAPFRPKFSHLKRISGARFQTFLKVNLQPTAKTAGLENLSRVFSSAPYDNYQRTFCRARRMSFRWLPPLRRNWLWFSSLPVFRRLRDFASIVANTPTGPLSSRRRLSRLRQGTFRPSSTFRSPVLNHHFGVYHRCFSRRQSGWRD